MRIVIVGAGAVGGLLGAMLADSGADVAFVARGATRDRLRARGVRVQTPERTFEAGPFEAEAEPEKLAPADAVLVSVKTFQLAALAPTLRPLLRPDSVILSLLNGVEAGDVLSASVGEAHVVGGLCHVLASAESPGEIVVKGAALRVSLGELAGGSSDRIEALAAVLRRAGVTMNIATDIRAEIWTKLLFVGPLGMVGAATGLSVDQFRSIDASRGLLLGAMDEVRRVAKQRGVTVSDENVAAAISRLDSLPAGSRTSMQRDIEARRPSELEEQVGVIARLGVDVPIHRVLHALLVARSQPMNTA